MNDNIATEMLSNLEKFNEFCQLSFQSFYQVKLYNAYWGKYDFLKNAFQYAAFVAWICLISSNIQMLTKS